jgi:hypothetical protein
LGFKLPTSIAYPSASEAQNNLSIKTLSSNPASTRARARNCPKTQTKIKAKRRRKTTWHQNQAITSRLAQAAKGSAFTMILEKSAAQPPKPRRRRDLSKSTIITHQAETQSVPHQSTAEDGNRGATFRSPHPLSHTLPPQRVDTLIPTFQPSKHSISLTPLPTLTNHYELSSCILFYRNDGVTGYFWQWSMAIPATMGKSEWLEERCRISCINHFTA